MTAENGLQCLNKGKYWLLLPPHGWLGFNELGEKIYTD